MIFFLIIRLCREHYQWNMDIFGVADVEAEAELLSSIVHSFQTMGISEHDVGIKVFVIWVVSIIFAYSQWTRTR